MPRARWRGLHWEGDGAGGWRFGKGNIKIYCPLPPSLTPSLNIFAFTMQAHTHTQTDTCNAATYALKHLYFVWKYVCRPIISTCTVYSTYRIPTHLAPWSILDMSAGNLLGSIDGEGWGAERVGRRVGASGWRKEKYAQHPQARKCAACALFLQYHGWPGLFIWKQIMKCVLQWKVCHPRAKICPHSFSEGKIA